MKTSLRGMALALLLANSAAAATIQIDSCGVTVPSRDVGVLAVNLNCPADQNGVILEPGARLILNGRSIAGGYHAVHAPGDSTNKRTRIRGPGTLENAARCGVAMSQSMDIRDVLIRGNSECGIMNARNESLKLVRVYINDNRGDGIYMSIVKQGLGKGIFRANELHVSHNDGLGIQLYSPPGNYRLSNFSVRHNGRGGISIGGRRPGLFAWGWIESHQCDLTTSAGAEPLMRGQVVIGTRCIR